MINKYKHTREEIIKMILSFKKTQDGCYFFTKDFYSKYIKKKGEQIDDSFYYERRLFENNLYFTSKDIYIFLSKVKLNINTDEYYNERSRFKTLNEEIIGKSLNYKLRGKDFNVEELIDTNEFFNTIKNKV